MIAKFLGPEEYGRFALAYATAIFVQTGFFDWIRLGATRFYSAGVVSEEPALRATLDFGFAIITPGLRRALCLLLFTGINFTLVLWLDCPGAQRRRRQRTFRLSYGARSRLF